MDLEGRILYEDNHLIAVNKLPSEIVQGDKTEDVPLSEQLNEAIQNIHATVTEYEIDDISNDDEVTLPADPNVRNFSFTVIDSH